MAKAEFESTINGKTAWFVAENTEDDDTDENAPTWFDYFTQLLGF